MTLQQAQAIISFLNAFLLRNSGFVAYVGTPATRLVLGVPVVTKKGKIIMANYQLANDEIVAFPILTADAAGALVPAPSGDTFSVTSSNPTSLNAVIGTMPAPSTDPAVVINALVQLSPGLSFTLSDSAKLTSAVQGVDIVADVAPTMLEIGSPVSAGTQPVPTAPGP